MPDRIRIRAAVVLRSILTAAVTTLIAGTMPLFTAGCSEDEGGDPGRCTGEAVPCSEIVMECLSQTGCELVETCGGQPTDCSGWNIESACLLNSGCYWTLWCEGTAAPCISYDYPDCNAQEGCGWSWSSFSCAGEATTCSETSVFDCSRQDGCRVEGACDGTPGPCWEQPVESCFTRPGCGIVRGCGGTARPCHLIFYAAACNAQSGCVWREE